MRVAVLGLLCTIGLPIGPPLAALDRHALAAEQRRVEPVPALVHMGDDAPDPKPVVDAHVREGGAAPIFVGGLTGRNGLPLLSRQKVIDVQGVERVLDLVIEAQRDLRGVAGADLSLVEQIVVDLQHQHIARGHLHPRAFGEADGACL